MSKYHNIGIIGMGVMGRNLALNMAGKGFKVAVYDYWQDRVAALSADKDASGLDISGASTVQDFVNMLEAPRKILIMVKAGDPVDEVIDTLLPLLSKGDILIDGGNSFFQDTIRRSLKLKDLAFEFIGVGISGGEEGALNGPAIMPGGSKTSYEKVENILTSIAAKAGGHPCCQYIGSDGAGHFVKMVHNGIEYGDMQLICEAYHILKNLTGLNAEELHNVFSEWNNGELKSYLIEITADIFKYYDQEAGLPLIDIILDKADQKGTGMWASQVSLDLGVPAPTITEAVFARYLSSLKDERMVANKVFSRSDTSVKLDCSKKEFIEAVRKALYASKICCYAQGFQLMKAASARYGWELDLSKIAAIFRGGCIIRAQFLDRIMEAYDKSPVLSNLLMSSYFRDIIDRYQDCWRKTVSAAIHSGIPIPAFTSALSYFDSYRCDRLPANLLQAQRDYFGAHTFERVDKKGSFHIK
ncbi:MAG: NADP-dependent phosphogluconate dehydrogenase [Clostridia bacterium]|nr:NADP-dependent phosphogluconate dehydrogenase [Clostridia bacterium]